MSLVPLVGCQDSLVTPQSQHAADPGVALDGEPDASARNGASPTCTVRTSSPQAAVDDASPGDVVCVEPGTYEGPLTVGVEEITVTAVGSAPATISGGNRTLSSAVRLEADGVTFEGFEVTFPGGLIGVSIAPNTDGVTVRDNRVHDLGPTGRLGVTGIIAQGGNADIAIAGNVVENLRNEFTADSGFPTVNGIFANDDRADGFTGSVIRDNVVRRLRSDNAVLGLLLQGTVSGVEVRGNEIAALSADPANDTDPTDDDATYDDNLDDGFDGPLATFAQGINVDASSTSDLLVTRNVVREVVSTGFTGEAVKVDDGAEGLTVTLNDLLATAGVVNGTSEPVAATCNYWGHPKGPRVVGTNPAADDGPNRQDRSAVVGPVDVQPWLVRSVTTGENLQRSCVGGRGR